MSEERSLDGRVIKSFGNRFIVLTAEGTFDCSMRGKFRLSELKESSPVAVGDRVTINVEEPPYGVIAEVHERKTKLSRPDVLKAEWEQILVTNCDQLIVVASVTRPKLKFGTIDRFLIAGEAAGLDCAVALTKIDLAKPGSYDRVLEVYRAAGYKIIPTSAVDGRGIDELREFVKLKTSIFSGHSGVGKSSLLNALEPGLGIRTQEISEATDKGQHTTTHIELHPLSFGGYIADTPGIRSIGLWKVTPEDMPYLYREFRPYLGQCRFGNCLHIGEPNCRVKQAVEEGAIAPERYDGYLRIRNTLNEE
jgi:ribosome biogenesis GTPase